MPRSAWAFAVALLPPTVSLPAMAADEAGQIAFNNHCRNCHSYQKGDHRLGPSLFGIVGAKAGQKDGFNNYSGSLRGLTWDEATLDRFIANPAAVAPNTNMIYPPVEDAEVRGKIIEFLKTRK